MEIPTGSWNPEDLDGLRIYSDLSDFGVNTAVQALQLTTHKAQVIQPSVDTSFHIWYAIRWPYSVLIFSLCSQVVLLKAQLGNMTHVEQSFQSLLLFQQAAVVCSSSAWFPKSEAPSSHLFPTAPWAGMLRVGLFCKDKHLGADLSSDRQTWFGKQKRAAVAQSQFNRLVLGL